MDNPKVFSHTISQIRSQLVDIQKSANACSHEISHLKVTAEASKMDLLLKELGDKKESISLARGTQLVMKGNGRNTILFHGLSNILLGYLKSGSDSAYSALSGANGAVNGIKMVGNRDIDWIVIISGDTIRIVALERGQAIPLVNRMKWETFEMKASELKQRALSGEELGDLDAILKKICPVRLVNS